jgi:hypothetical protein
MWFEMAGSGPMNLSYPLPLTSIRPKKVIADSTDSCNIQAHKRQNFSTLNLQARKLAQEGMMLTGLTLT